MNNLVKEIQAKAKELGYDGCGVIPAVVFTEFAGQLKRRSGLFPHSEFFYRRLERLTEPRNRAEWARSVVVCVRHYNRYRILDGLDRYVGKLYLFDGDLPYAPEYAINTAMETYLHNMGMRTLQNGVPARWAAVKAGLGRFRKNNFFYTKYGSWNLIDTWLVDQELTEENWAGPVMETCPDGCRNCIEACPTGALSKPLTMDATQCIAYLSFTPGVFPGAELREKMGTWLYGCDLCQNACPANAGSWLDAAEEFPEPERLGDWLDLERLWRMDSDTYRKKIQPRFSYFGPEDAVHWRWAALRAMANTGEAEYRKYFAEGIQDPDVRLQELGAWAEARWNQQGK